MVRHNYIHKVVPHKGRNAHQTNHFTTLVTIDTSKCCAHMSTQTIADCRKLCFVMFFAHLTVMQLVQSLFKYLHKKETSAIIQVK